MNRIVSLALVFGTWSLHADTAQAQIVYSYVADLAPVTNTTTGIFVTATVYLQEKLSANSPSSPPSSLIAAGGGLFGAGVTLNASGTSVSITGATLNNTDFPLNSGTATASGTSGTITDQANPGGAFATKPTSSTTATADGVTTTTNQYLLGTFTLTGTASAGPTTFSLVASNGSGGGVTTTGTASSTSYYDLDVSNGGTGDFSGTSYTGASDTTNSYRFSNTAAVPEPGSMALCGLAAFALGFCGWRRRKSQTAEPETQPGRLMADGQRIELANCQALVYPD